LRRPGGDIQIVDANGADAGRVETADSAATTSYCHRLTDQQRKELVPADDEATRRERVDMPMFW